MKSALLPGLWLAGTILGAAAAEPREFRSRSGQFVVHGLPLAVAPLPQNTGSNVTYVRLTPSVLVVSLERIREALLTEIGLLDAWSGRIDVFLRPLRQDREPIRVTSIRYTDKWHYRLDLPEYVDRRRFLRAAVQVLLMEIANRRAGTRQAEMPPWLAEGLLAHLRASTLATLTLEPQTSMVRDGRKRDPLLGPRECLRTNTPLTLDQLNLPTEELRTGPNEEIYRCCAHLFVRELLLLKNGAGCLREMLRMLPDYLNWQTAFLRAFEPHFPRLRDVDKWWSLNLVHLTGRDLFSIWPHAQSLEKLNEILRVPIEVRVQTNDLPVTTDATLQTVIAQWAFPKLAPVIRQRIDLLLTLRPRVPPELAGLVDGYRGVLESYLAEADRLGLSAQRRGKGQVAPRWLATDLDKRLTELDVQRELLQDQSVPQQNSRL